jgi:hypothetical protein
VKGMWEDGEACRPHCIEEGTDGADGIVVGGGDWGCKQEVFQCTVVREHVGSGREELVEPRSYVGEGWAVE